MAGGLIAFGVFWGSGNGQVAKTDTQQGGAVGTQVAYAAQREEGNHIFGDKNAPITIVEFSDYECPFCSRLHPTLEKIVSDSGGTIKWEYRHLPLPNHKNAEAAALSAECVAQLAGNDAFWSFTQTIFQNQRSVKTDFLEEEAVQLGISIDDLRSCINDPEVGLIVQNDLDTAISFGGRGTPFSVIVYADGSTKSVVGALPPAQWNDLFSAQ